MGKNPWKRLYKTDIALLMYLASKSNLYESLIITTTKAAKELGISQQSVSRKLFELEEEVITRKTTNKGIEIKLTRKGISVIQDISNQISASCDKNFVFKGYLTTGLGEGKYYMSRNNYKKSFKKLLGYTPWPGTFNLKLESQAAKEAINSIKPIIVKGFKEKNRSFGKLKCYECTILDKPFFYKKIKNSKKELDKKGFMTIDKIPDGVEKKTKIHIIVPERTSHPTDVIEIIATVYLRKLLNVKEKNEIMIALKT